MQQIRSEAPPSPGVWDSIRYNECLNGRECLPSCFCVRRVSANNFTYLQWIVMRCLHRRWVVLDVVDSSTHDSTCLSSWSWTIPNSCWYDRLRSNVVHRLIVWIFSCFIVTNTTLSEELGWEPTLFSLHCQDIWTQSSTSQFHMHPTMSTINGLPNLWRSALKIPSTTRALLRTARDQRRR